MGNYHTFTEGTPFSGMPTVSQKFFPASREIFSSNVNWPRMASILGIMWEPILSEILGNEDPGGIGKQCKIRVIRTQPKMPVTRNAAFSRSTAGVDKADVDIIFLNAQ